MQVDNSMNVVEGSTYVMEKLRLCEDLEGNREP